MDFRSESRSWGVEVDVEAARLIRLGVPPWDAAIQARQRVEKRRREAAQASEQPPSDAAVDPSAASTGTLTPRDGSSSSLPNAGE